MLSISLACREVRLTIKSRSWVISFRHPNYQEPWILISREWRNGAGVFYADVIWMWRRSHVQPK